MENKKEVKKNIALIGLGYWGKNILRNLDESDLVGKIYVYDNSLNSSLLTHKCVVIEDENKIFMEDNDIDAVFVATPPSSHYRFVKKALINGKDVFCEKPLTTKFSDAIELYNIAETRNLINKVDFINMHNDAYKYIKSEYNNGNLGKLKIIKNHKSSFGKFYDEVDILLDSVIHDLSIYFDMINPNTIEVKSSMNSFHRLENDMVSASMEFDDTKIEIDANAIFPNKNRITTFYGEKKIIVWDELSDEKISEYVIEESQGIFKMKKMESKKNFTKSESLKESINDFLEAIVSREKCSYDFKFASEVLRVVDKIQLASINLNG